MNYKLANKDNLDAVEAVVYDHIPADRDLSMLHSGHGLFLDIPACGDYPAWVPTTPDEYSCPIGKDIALCSLSYTQFLAMYFDIYVGGRYNDGYAVTKHSRGRDSSDTHDIYEYDFCPKHYNRTMLISAGMNASELPAEFGAAYFIKGVMEPSEPGLQYYHDNVRIKIIPCLCPGSFDQSPLLYNNTNGISINQNFDYDGAWQTLTGSGSTEKGDAPCDQAETQAVLRWLSANTGNADVWIDCHTDASGGVTDAHLHYVLCSSANLGDRIKAEQAKITDYYIDAGTITSQTPKTAPVTSVAPTNRYPKTAYAKAICDIDAIMIEQYTGNTKYGGVSTINNGGADIANYAATIHACGLAALRREAVFYTESDISYMIYQLYRDSHGRSIDDGYVRFENGTFDASGEPFANAARARTYYLPIQQGDLLLAVTLEDVVFVEGWCYTSDGTKNGKLTANPWTATSGTAYVRLVFKKEDDSVMRPSYCSSRAFVGVNGVVNGSAYRYGKIDTTKTPPILDHTSPNRAVSGIIPAGANRKISITKLNGFGPLEMALCDETGIISSVVSNLNIPVTVNNHDYVVDLKNIESNFVIISFKNDDNSNISMDALKKISVRAY